MPKPLKDITVCVVGGSIAGCAIAKVLTELGVKVTVLERSANSLSDRGAGIMLPETTSEECFKLDLLDTDIPRYRVTDRTLYRRDEKTSNGSTEIWQQAAANVGSLHWRTICLNLRKRIPSTSYQGGKEISDLQKTSTHDYLIKTKDGVEYKCDLIIAADGINSFIRQKVFPNVKAESAGYVAWRGTIDDSKVADQKMFDGHVPHYVFSGGLLLLYRIPNAANPKASTLNWIMYDDCRAIPSAAKKLFFDKLSVSPNNLTADNLKYLHTFAKHHLPAAIAAIICQTTAPFLQHIVDLHTPAYQHERVFFTGDAATVLRPHLAAGAKTALDSAIALAAICREDKPKDLDALTLSLAKWSKKQLESTNNLVPMAKRMGAALVTHAPDWNKMDAKSTPEWWDTHVMKGQPWHMTSNTYQTPRAKL